MALLAMPLAASAWTPDGDVTVIVAYKAGSGTDTGARLLASQAEKYVGKTLIINNLPGSDGKIGWTELVNSKPDGRTIGFINLPTFTTLAVQPGSTFAVSDVVPVCNQLSETGVVVVRANSPWKSLKELVDACKAKGNLRCSTNGVEASNHTAAQLLATSAGFNYKAIPYGGTADQLLALLTKEELDIPFCKQQQRCLSILERIDGPLSNLMEIRKERARRYYASVFPSAANRFLVFDMGYSGSISIALSTIAGKPFDKLYCLMRAVKNPLGEA